MSENKQAKIFIIAPPGRKRENLLTIVNATLKPFSAQIAENCQQLSQIIQSDTLNIVLIDYRKPAVDLNADIITFHQHHPDIFIILLQNHPDQNRQYSEDMIREVIYDDISSDILQTLVHDMELSFGVASKQ